MCSKRRSKSRRSAKSCSNRLSPAVYCKLFKKLTRRRRKVSRRRSRRRVKRTVRRRSRSKRRSRSRSRRHGVCPCPKRRKGGRRKSRRRRSRRKGKKVPIWMRAKKSRGKCAAQGPKTANPFLNFMRLFRRKRCGWPASKIAIEGARIWCRMHKKDKMRFYREACSKRKKKVRRGGKGRGKRRRSGRR